MKVLHMITFALLVIGGLNWGIEGVSNGYNVVHAILGSWSWLEMLVYILVGLSAIYEVATHKANCKMCSMGMKDGGMMNKSTPAM